MVTIRNNSKDYHTGIIYASVNGPDHPPFLKYETLGPGETFTMDPLEERPLRIETHITFAQGMEISEAIRENNMNRGNLNYSWGSQRIENKLDKILNAE